MIDWLQTRLGISPELQLRLLATLATMVGLWLVHRIALSLVYRRVRDPRSRYRWRKTLTYLVYVAGIVIVGPMWFAWVESFTTIVGFLSAGLAIALKDPVSNLAGWAFILWRRPFEVGDRIQIGPHAGDVIDLGLFQFTLNEIGAWVQADQSSGRIIHVPNGKIFTEFAKCPDIDLAYHTVRGFKNTDEGKPALRAPAMLPQASGERVDE